MRWAVALKIIVVQSTEGYGRMSGEPMVQSDGVVMRLYTYHSSNFLHITHVVSSMSPRCLGLGYPEASKPLPYTRKVKSEVSSLLLCVHRVDRFPINKMRHMFFSPERIVNLSLPMSKSG